MREQFLELFDQEPAVQAAAHGRVNLMGDHTDYNGGFVLPICIPQVTNAHMAARGGRTVRAFSACVGSEVVTFDLDALAPDGTWTDYVKGVLCILEQQVGRIEGFDLMVDSTVPVGSGLSSSAALEIAVLRGVRELFNLTVGDVELAKIGQRAENDFVGAPVGIMDQMASSVGDTSHALYLDTRTLGFEQVALPRTAALIVIDSGVTHHHASGEYRTRRAECERAARELHVPQLRDITEVDDVMALAEPFRRRARHVITENARVAASVHAIRANDLHALGICLQESHASLRDDFEASVPQVDELVELAMSEPAVVGARITGGGFGGCVVAIAQADDAHRAAERIVDKAQRKGGHAKILVPMEDRS
jgi:galactokinase